MYKYIGKETWEKFVKSHETPEFLPKRQRRNENNARNAYPHRLSCGGYMINWNR